MQDESKVTLEKINPSVKGLLLSDTVKAKFQELLGKRSSAFITSVLQVVSQNSDLMNADPTSVYHAASVAATLDLPINNNIGFAYIIPYRVKQADGTYRPVAQFQMGYKGFIQLAQRSGQFKTIAAAPIYVGHLTSHNPLTGFVFDFDKKKSDVVIGYAAYFSLLNGFEKTLFMSITDLKKHGAKYSKTFTSKSSLWNTDFDGMATKTVLKLLLSKFAPLSIEMQQAVITDQAIINNPEGTDVTYVDSEATVVEVNKEEERAVLLINDAQTIDDLDALFDSLPDTVLEKYLKRKEELSAKK